MNDVNKKSKSKESRKRKEKKVLVSPIKIEYEESIQYLISEYEQCFIQMRHYNDHVISLSKFIFSILAAVISGAFALFQYLQGETYQNAVVGIIFALALFIGFAFLQLMVKNRLYFIIVARQVNSLRNYFLHSMVMNYSVYSVGYTNPDVPRKMDPWSRYTVMFWMLSIVNGALAAGSYYFFARYFTLGGELVYGTVIGVAVLLIQIILICISLLKNNAVEPDKTG